MNRHKRVRCALALLTMLTAGLLFGCVSDAASDSTLPTITVGSDTYPPYVYMDNNGDITGLDVDIAGGGIPPHGIPRGIRTTIDWEQKPNWSITEKSTASGTAFPWTAARTTISGRDRIW